MQKILKKAERNRTCIQVKVKETKTGRKERRNKETERKIMYKTVLA